MLMGRIQPLWVATTLHFDSDLRTVWMRYLSEISSDACMLGPDGRILHTRTHTLDSNSVKFQRSPYRPNIPNPPLLD